MKTFINGVEVEGEWNPEYLKQKGIHAEAPAIEVHIRCESHFTREQLLAEIAKQEQLPSSPERDEFLVKLFETLSSMDAKGAVNKDETSRAS